MNQFATSFDLKRLGWLLCAIGAFFVASHIPHTLSIFILAALIAFGAGPVTYRLERRMPRTLAIGVVYAGLLLAIAVLVIIIVPDAIAQAQNVLETMPAQIDHMQQLVDQSMAHLQGRFGRSFGVGLQNVRALINVRIEAATTVAFTSLGSCLLNAVTSLFVFVSALVLSAFFISRSEAIAEGFRQIFPPQRRHLADEFEHEVARVFGGFVAGQVSLCVLTGTLVWTALTLMHVPFAMLIGVVTAIGYAVPFLGMVVVQVFAALLAAPMGLSTVIWVTAIIFCIARIIDNVITPKIMSESVGVSPIAVMFAVFAGGELFGISGLVLGIPAAALIKTLWKVYQHAQADAKLSAIEDGRVISVMEVE